MTAKIRAKLIDAALFLVVVALMYAGLAVATSAFHWPVPLSGDVVLALGWVAWRAGHGLDSALVLLDAARRWRRDRESASLGEVFESYQIVYRVGSPPSHAAGGAR